MEKRESLEIKQCLKCKAAAKEVVYAEKKVRQGWYCAICNSFDPAIGRERKI
jgi:hypothetical protein